MKIAELATKKVITLNTTEPIARALVLMQDEGIRHIPILRTRVPVGMVTDHDILAHVGWLHKSRSNTAPRTDRVEKIMSSPLVALAPQDPIENAARLMLTKRIGAIAVIDGEHLTGIVTETDFLQYLTDAEKFPNDAWKTRSVATTMSSAVHCVQPGDNTVDAIKLMRTQQLRHLPVVEKERLVGILSYRDVVRGAPRDTRVKPAFARNSPVLSPLHVRGIMTADVVTLNVSATLSQAAERMKKSKISALPLMEGDQLRGIITETDLLRSLIES